MPFGSFIEKDTSTGNSCGYEMLCASVSAAVVHVVWQYVVIQVWRDARRKRIQNHLVFCFYPRNVVKSFYTAGMLFDVLTIFGELPEELVQNRKYAKWKAAYIHNCLKNGETPVPGPLQEEGELDDGSLNEEGNVVPASSGFQGGYRDAGMSGIG